MMTTAAINQPVLVLNKSWTPLNYAPMKRALSMVINGRAKVVDPVDFQALSWADWSAMRPGDDENVFRGIGTEFRLPEVIVLQHYDRLPKPKASFSRRTLFKRDHYRCQYCGCQPGTEELTIDHVLPRAQGGVTSWENCVLACVACNAKKANRTPEQAKMPLKKLPTKPPYAMWKAPSIRIKSWEQFLGECYWEVQLKD